MKRNSTTLFLESPGAITPIPWVNGVPDFSDYSEPTLSVLLQSWQQFLNSGEELEIIPDPEPVVEVPQPNWDEFNAFMLTNPMFKYYRDSVRAVDGDLTSALYNAYNLVSTNGVAAFSLVWGVWCQVSNIIPADREVIALAAESFNLPPDFITVIRG